METIYVDNSRFIEVVSEITEIIVHQFFGDKALVSDGSDGWKYSEEAQDLFNEEYDHVEYLLNIRIGVYSNNES